MCPLPIPSPSQCEVCFVAQVLPMCVSVDVWWSLSDHWLDRCSRSSSRWSIHDECFGRMKLLRERRLITLRLYHSSRMWWHTKLFSEVNLNANCPPVYFYFIFYFDANVTLLFILFFKFLFHFVFLMLFFCAPVHKFFWTLKVFFFPFLFFLFKEYFVFVVLKRTISLCKIWRGWTEGESVLGAYLGEECGKLNHNFVSIWYQGWQLNLM